MVLQNIFGRILENPVIIGGDIFSIKITNIVNLKQNKAVIRNIKLETNNYVSDMCFGNGFYKN